MRPARELRQVGSDLAIVDGAADLEQEIGPASAPAHLLRFVHPAVDEMVGGPFGDRGSHPQTGAVPRGVIDQPRTLTCQIAVEPEKSGPEWPGSAVLAPLGLPVAIRAHDAADAVNRGARIPGLAMPQPPAQPLNRLDDHRFGRALGLIAGRQAPRGLPEVLQAHGDVKPV